MHLQAEILGAKQEQSNLYYLGLQTLFNEVLCLWKNIKDKVGQRRICFEPVACNENVKKK